MRALFYDIHGNLPALEAVVADAGAQGVEEYLLGGDYALFGARPEECVKLIESLNGEWIRGNTERWLEDPSDAPDNELLHSSIDYCRAKLGVGRVEELFRLPPAVSVDGALVCHASPHDDMVTFMPEATDADRELLAHTVNPGSVGLPFDGDRRAAYALWRGGHEIELRRVEYDWKAYAVDVRKRMADALGEQVETLVRRVETAAM